MTLGYRGTVALLAIPFLAYAAASVVASYQPIVGSGIPKGPALPPAEDFAKGRERTARIATGAQAVGQLAFTGSPDNPPDTLPDDMRKLARGIGERNQTWENVRLYLSDPKTARYKGPSAKMFEGK